MRALRYLSVSAALLAVGALPIPAQTALYQPESVPSGAKEVSGRLTDRDIPTGDGGFARDYKIQLQEGDRLTVDAFSENFDTLVILLAADGSVVAENDDGPDGTTNSLLFARIDEAGDYTVRIRSYGETGGGDYTLTFTRLRPVE